MPHPLLKLATSSRLFVQACGCCKFGKLPVTTPNIRQWCLNTGIAQGDSMEHGLDFKLRAKQVPLATCCHPYTDGWAPTAIHAGDITSTDHGASFIISVPAFFAGTHYTIKKPASHQHCQKSHDTLRLQQLSKLNVLVIAF